MQNMTQEEYRAFLQSPARTASVATVRPDGRPHVAPVWFDLDGDVIVFTTWHTSVKAINLRHDHRIALSIDDEAPPFSFVLVEGTAIFDSDPDRLRYWATRIGGKYMGAERAEEYGQRNGVEGELLVRVQPTKIVAKKGITE